MPSGLLLVYLHPVLVVEPGGTSEMTASVRDRLSLTRKEKLWCKVCLLPHLEQGEMPPVETGHWSLFSLLQMGANNSSLTPLNCPYMLGTNKAIPEVSQQLNYSDWKHLGFLPQEICNIIIPMFSNPNSGPPFAWPGTDWDWISQSCWLAPNRTYWICGSYLQA